MDEEMKTVEGCMLAMFVFLQFELLLLEDLQQLKFEAELGCCIIEYILRLVISVFAPDFVALGSFIEKIEDDNCCDYTTRELYDMLFMLESKHQETASLQ